MILFLTREIKGEKKKYLKPQSTGDDCKEEKEEEGVDDEGREERGRERGGTGKEARKIKYRRKNKKEE